MHRITKQTREFRVNHISEPVLSDKGRPILTSIRRTTKLDGMFTKIY